MLLLFFVLAFVNAEWEASEEPTKEVVCEAGAIDLVFVLDESGSVEQPDFERAKGACVQLSRALEIGPGLSQSNVGFVVFNDAGSVAFQLTTYHTNEDVENAIRGVSYSSGGTNIANGMSVAINQVFSERGRGRESVPQVMIVITDGQDNSNVASVHALAVRQNITTFALGVGSGVNVAELNDVTGDRTKVYSVSDYYAIANVMNQICVEIEASLAPSTNTAPRECPCTLNNLWLDIVFVLDSSNGVSENDFTSLKALLMGFVHQIKISQQLGQYTRLAIINAAQTAERVSGLTRYNSNDEALADFVTLQFHGSDDFNIALGLIEAQRVLDETDKRANVRNLVILFTSHGVDCKSRSKVAGVNLAQDDEDPCRIAAHMVEDVNTDLMTVALKFHENNAFPLLDFGSPCFAAVNDIDLMSNMQKLACKANCFCQNQYTQFKSTEECHDYGECVYPKGIAAAYLTAQIGCQLDHTTLADVHSKEKGSFLKDIAVKDKQIPYWIGLQKTNGQFYWDSGSVLGRADYTNWARNQPDQKDGDCVFVKQSSGFAVQWFTAKCDWGTPSYYYFCQKNTCDTDNYCS